MRLQKQATFRQQKNRPVCQGLGTVGVILTAAFAIYALVTQGKPA